MGEQVLKTYKVFPGFPDAPPPEIAAGGDVAVRAWEIEQTKRSLVMIRDGVRKVFAEKGGGIAHDAMGYGVPGAADEEEGFLVIACTPVTAYRVSLIREVREVHEIRDKKTLEEKEDPPELDFF